MKGIILLCHLLLFAGSRLCNGRGSVWAAVRCCWLFWGCLHRPAPSFSRCSVSGPAWGSLFWPSAFSVWQAQSWTSSTKPSSSASGLLLSSIFTGHYRAGALYTSGITPTTCSSSTTPKPPLPRVQARASHTSSAPWPTTTPILSPSSPSSHSASRATPATPIPSVRCSASCRPCWCCWRASSSRSGRS